MCVKSFLEYVLLEKNYSRLTAEAYGKDLESFSKFIQSEYGAQDLDQVNYSQIRSWIVSLVEKGLSNRTINRKVSTLKTYYKFLLKIERIECSPLLKHKALKVDKKIQVPFSEMEISNVLNDLLQKDDFVAVRDRFVVELLYSTGIRRIELVELQMSSLDLDRRILKVLGKRNKERIIPLLESVSSTAKQYLRLRSELQCIIDGKYLFLTLKGAKIYETLVYRIINSYFSLVSSKVKKSPHVIRHSFATHLLNQGASLNAVKELLGHASLSSTQVYLHNSIAELKKIHLRTHPRGRHKKE